MAIRNIIRNRVSTQPHHSKGSMTPARLIRLLVLCAVIGIWPLTALTIGFRDISVIRNPWPGWTASHKYFHTIPKFSSFIKLPPDFGPLEEIFWVDVVSACLIFAILVCTEDVRNDLHQAWNIVTCKVFRLPYTRRRHAQPPPIHDSSAGNESNDVLLVSLPGMQNISTANYGRD
jgi:hypothetical protein